MTAELTEERIAEISERFRRSVGLTATGNVSPDEFYALCDAALLHVRARGQKPVGKVCGEDSARMFVDLPNDTPLFTTPQPSYAESMRDGLLAAAKVCDTNALLSSMNGAISALKATSDELRALADKEPT